MGKEWTPERRKAFGEKMKQAREANRKSVEIHDNPPGDDGNDYESLKKRVLELEALLTPKLSTPQVAGGKMVGTLEKYKLGADNYPDPIGRLARETRLSRFAFDDNYELNFVVGQSSYTTIDGIRTVEPKFTLQLIRKIYDEDTGEPTNKRYGVTQLIFHEDPDTAIAVARDNGIEVDTMNEKMFLDEMRYLRMRDWLMGCFFPEPPAAKSNKKEMVIGNRLVEVWEVSSESPERIDFSKLDKKL